MACAYCGGILIQEKREVHIDHFICKITRYFKECDHCAIARIEESYEILGGCVRKNGNRIWVDWEEYWCLEAEAHVKGENIRQYFKNCAVIFFESINIINKKKGFKVYSLYVEQIGRGYFFRRKYDANLYVKKQFVKQIQNPSIFIRFAKLRKIYVP